MGKVVGAISMSLLLASAGAAWSQEIGIVSTPPKAGTGDLIVDIPARPDGEKVYIVRNGTLVTDATVKSSGGRAELLSVCPTIWHLLFRWAAGVSLSPSLAKQLPASAYKASAPGNVRKPRAAPAGCGGCQASGGKKTVVSEIYCDRDGRSLSLRWQLVFRLSTWPCAT